MSDQTLTYQDLNQAANRLAHSIIARRGTTQETIALLMEHELPLFVAIMGVLKAGKICLVLDPSFPKDRSAFLLQDSRASLLIADGENLSLAEQSAYQNCGVVNVEQLGWAGSRQSGVARLIAGFGVFDLHIGLHRAAQGRRTDACQPTAR